jgi:hypothetical protein
MKPNHWPLLVAALIGGGCVDNKNSLVIVQNQLPDPTMMNCAVPGMATPVELQAGILDVGLVAAGYAGYQLYPLVRSDILDRSNATTGVAQEATVELRGVDVQLAGATGSTGASLVAGLSQPSSFFAPSFGGNIVPAGGTGAMIVTVITRQAATDMAKALAGLPATTADFPTVTVHFRAVGTHSSDNPFSDTITSGWADFPVQICSFCLTAPPMACPTPPPKKADITLGACNPSQDRYVSCCTQNGATLCGSLYPVSSM